MSIRPTSQIGEKIIRQKSVAVKEFTTKEVRQVIKDLTDSMRHGNLVGMAAPQIGKGLQIFVSEIRQTAYRKIVQRQPLKVFINPKIVWKSKKQVIGYEGCGSVAQAGLFGLVSRAESVICEAVDEKRQSFKIKASGLLARIIQHEVDHLNGLVFIDRIGDLKTLVDKKIYTSFQKE